MHVTAEGLTALELYSAVCNPGGGPSFFLKDGPFKGWHIGGAAREDVYGKSQVSFIPYTSEPFTNLSPQLPPDSPRSTHVTLGTHDHRHFS